MLRTRVRFGVAVAAERDLPSQLSELSRLGESYAVITWDDIEEDLRFTQKTLSSVYFYQLYLVPFTLSPHNRKVFFVRGRMLYSILLIDSRTHIYSSRRCCLRGPAVIGEGHMLCHAAS